jgi:hypothetical protein
LEQESEQLPASPPQVVEVKSQLPPELHEQDAPLHVGADGGALDPPQAFTEIAIRTTVTRARIAHGIGRNPRH